MMDIFAVLAEKHLDSVVADDRDHVRHRRNTDRRAASGGRSRKRRAGRDA